MHAYAFDCICINMHNTGMKNIVDILSAIAEPSRFQAIQKLWDGGEHCVCELMEELCKSQSCTSRHMTALKKAGLIVDRRDAQWVRYRRNPDLPKDVVKLVNLAIKCAEETDKEL